MKMWYESIFEGYAEKYEKESFAQGTAGECDFIEQEIDYNKQVNILDIGCGTGRHSIELKKRGYDITGIDLSDSLLKLARRKAEQQNLDIIFLKMDARELNFTSEYGLVIMICEGAFPLMETDEMNFRILQNAANALKVKGKLILTTLNALYPLFNSLDDFFNSAKGKGNAASRNSSFDLMTFRDHNIVEVEDDYGNKKELKCNERYYAPCEINWLLKSLGFNNIDICGAKLGNFSRRDRLTAENYEMLVIAEK